MPATVTRPDIVHHRLYDPEVPLRGKPWRRLSAALVLPNFFSRQMNTRPIDFLVIAANQRVTDAF